MIGCVLKILRRDHDLFLTFQNLDAKSHHCFQTPGPRYMSVCIDPPLQLGVFTRGRNTCVYSCRVVDKAACTSDSVQ